MQGGAEQTTQFHLVVHSSFVMQSFAWIGQEDEDREIIGWPRMRKIWKEMKIGGNIDFDSLAKIYLLRR